MKAMIMAAGRGERLRPITDSQPKPMLDIAGSPLIEHQLGWLSRAGIHEIVINLHYLGESIESYLGGGAGFGVDIEYSWEAELLETGGGIVQALPLLGTAPFLVLNGDNWIDLDFATLGDLAPGQLAKLVLTPTPAFRDFGDFEVAHETVVARGGDYVYCSVGIHHPALFDGCSVERFSLRDLWFDQLSAGTIGAHRYNGFWSDIGTPEQLAIVREHVGAGRARTC